MASNEYESLFSPAINPIAGTGWIKCRVTAEIEAHWPPSIQGSSVPFHAGSKCYIVLTVTVKGFSVVVISSCCWWLKSQKKQTVPEQMAMAGRQHSSFDPDSLHGFRHFPHLTIKGMGERMFWPFSGSPPLLTFTEAMHALLTPSFSSVVL